MFSGFGGKRNGVRETRNNKIDYDSQAANWLRDEPQNIGDFIARPVVWHIFEKIGEDSTVLDLGCGEGYFSRKLSKKAAKVIGVDNSEEMISIALLKEKDKESNIEYKVGDAKNIPFIGNSTIDICIGNCIVNYFNIDELPMFFAEIARVLKETGKFILSFPQPALIHTNEYGEAMRYDLDNYDYIRSRGKFYKATALRIDGKTVEVGRFHTKIEDIFNGISFANLVVDNLLEPEIDFDIVKKYPLFKEAEGKILFMVISGYKP